MREMEEIDERVREVDGRKEQTKEREMQGMEGSGVGRIALITRSWRKKKEEV